MGATLTDAAAQAGVHRNTVANWRRALVDFREALEHAHYDRATLYRDRAIDLADLAFQTLREVLADPKASPSVRLRAATFIIEKAVTPPPAEKEKPARMADLFAAMAAQHADAQECTTLHNDAQPECGPEPGRREPEGPGSVFTLHNFAQKPDTYRRPDPKIGRNDPCPCGSGRKYKHCCLDKPAAGAA